MALMKYALPYIGLLSLAICSTPTLWSADGWKNPGTTASEPMRDIRDIRGIRIIAPRRQHTSSMTITVQAGDKLSAMGYAESITGTLQVSGPDGKTAAAELTLDRRQSRRPNAKRPYSGRTDIDVSEWPDGDYSVTFTAKAPDAAAAGADADKKKKLPKPASAKGRIIAKQFAGIAKDQQEELAYWLGDDNDARPIWGKRPAWKNIDKALAAPASPFKDLTGFVLRSYENPQYEDRQGYTVYVPEALDRSQPAPLMILLHGSGGDYRNLISDEAAGQRFEKDPMLIANAGAFGHQEYRHMALNDIRWVLADVSKKYQVDPQRVYLQGISLGGRGCLEAAALLPDTFAAISAQGVYGLQLELCDPLRDIHHDRIARSYRARCDIRSWLGNLLSVGVEICAGEDDVNTPPEQGQLFQRMLRFHGHTSAELRRFRTDHNMSMPDYDWHTTRVWMLKHKRSDAKADHVRFRVANLRFNRSAWLQVDRLQDYAQPGTIDIRIREQAAQPGAADGDMKSLAAVRSRGIRALQCDLPKAVDEFSIDDNKLGARAAGRLYLQKQDAAWTIVDEKTYLAYVGTAATHKAPGRSGPLWDVWSDKVTGAWDDSDASTKELLEKGIRSSCSWDRHRGNKSLPVSALSELEEERKKNGSVIIFTNDVRTCALTKDLSLPRPFDQDAGDKQVRLALRPSPWSAEHYLLVVEVPAEQEFSLHNLGWWDSGNRSDWAIVKPGTSRWRRSQIVAAGSYGHDWQADVETSFDYRCNAMLGPASGGR